MWQMREELRRSQKLNARDGVFKEGMKVAGWARRAEIWAQEFEKAQGRLRASGDQQWLSGLGLGRNV